MSHWDRFVEGVRRHVPPQVVKDPRPAVREFLAAMTGLTSRSLSEGEPLVDATAVGKALQASIGGGPTFVWNESLPPVGTPACPPHAFCIIRYGVYYASCLYYTEGGKDELHLVVFESGGGGVVLCGNLLVRLDGGCIPTGSPDKWVKFDESPAERVAEATGDPRDFDILEGVNVTVLAVTLSTFAAMHGGICGVRQVAPDSALVRARQKRGKPPPPTYHDVYIHDRFLAERDGVAVADGESVRRRMHAVRRHQWTKPDGTKEWRGPYWRGDASLGILWPRYKVSPPNGSAA